MAQFRTIDMHKASYLIVRLCRGVSKSGHHARKELTASSSGRSVPHGAPSADRHGRRTAAGIGHSMAEKARIPADASGRAFGNGPLRPAPFPSLLRSPQVRRTRPRPSHICEARNRLWRRILPGVRHTRSGSILLRPATRALERPSSERSLRLGQALDQVGVTRA